MINVIFIALERTGSSRSRVISVAWLPAKDSSAGLKRAKINIQPILRFLDKDKLGTIQPHDDALVITLKIGGYDVKRVLVDQGNAVEIMYPSLYKGLNLISKFLTAYDSALVSFEGKTVIPKGQIRVVEVDFIMVDSYSPYTAIVARPWLHALGAISSTLHQKVKYPSHGQVKEIVESQSMARKCMVAAKLHRPNMEPSVSSERNL